MRIFVVIAVAIVLCACSATKKAEKTFNKGEFQSSIEQFEDILKKNPNNGDANFLLAEAYRQSNRINKSMPYYRKAIENGVKNDSIGLFYALALKSNGNYKLANKQLEHYIASTNNEYFTKRANDEVQNISYLDEVMSKESFYRVKNLDKINSPNAEYSPVYADGYLYFVSSRDPKNKVYKATGTPFTNIYKVATTGANVDTTTIQALQGVINNSDINEGSVTFSPDGKTMVFARGNSGKRKGAADVNLYITRFRGGEWSDPRPLNINNINFWDSSPAFSSNGKVLYFSSNRPGGLGGTDLFSANMNTRGRFSQVKNLGPEINTTGNESFPYISDDGVMYFASDGHPGFGGLDLFVAKRSSGKINVENLGQPINSNADDFGLFLFKADRGFFTSNRDGGEGDDDIYTFVNEDPNLKVVNYYLKGITMTHDDRNSLRVLPNTKVELQDYNGDILDETITGENGEFLFRVYEQEHYVMIGENQGKGLTKYLKTRGEFTTHGKSLPPEELTKLVTNITLDTILVLEKMEINKVFVVENIYYDLDKWDIRDDAAIELDKLVQLLLDNPQIKIELSSHTDDRAPDDYNLKLSDRRARSAVNYLVKQGIDPARLTAKGYGETKLIIQNAQTEEDHQVNRRTEFKILEVTNTSNSSDSESFNEDQFFDDEEKEN